MSAMSFNVICESAEMTQKVLDLPRNLGDADKKVFSYMAFYDDLYNRFFAAYLGDLEKGDKTWKEDGKFKADFGNPFDSGNIDGFSKSCYINDYCMVISFYYDKNGKIYSWGWNKVHKGSLHNSLAGEVYIMAEDYLKMGDNLMSYSESCVENLEDEFADNRLVESPWCKKSEEVIVEIKDEDDENGEVQDKFAWITVKNVGNFILIEDVLIRKDCIKTIENKVEEESLVMVTLTDDEEHIWDYDNYEDDALHYIFNKIVECLSW